MKIKEQYKYYRLKKYTFLGFIHVSKREYGIPFNCEVLLVYKWYIFGIPVLKKTEKHLTIIIKSAKLFAIKIKNAYIYGCHIKDDYYLLILCVFVLRIE